MKFAKKLENVEFTLKSEQKLVGTIYQSNTFTFVRAYSNKITSVSELQNRLAIFFSEINLVLSR